jgi:3-deoxy-D-manno-octulosonic-acid transferase
MLYDIAFLIFSLFYLPTLIFKGKLHGDFAERFGKFSDKKRLQLDGALYHSPAPLALRASGAGSGTGQGAIWIQAVSVGEVALCRGLIPELRKAYPQKKIVLSTITRTGNDLAKSLFSGTAVIIYFPLDFSSVVRKVVELIRPSLYIMIETEIWPNVLRELSKQGVPSILINGRISDSSFGKYRLARPFLKGTIGMINSFCMQSNVDVARIECLGAPRDRVRMTGNMKFDADAGPDASKSEEMRNLLGLGGSSILLVGGSTHCPEEKILVRIFKKLSAEFPYLKLLLAPRHVDRSAEIEILVRRLGFEAVRISDAGRRTQDAGRIFILDTIGRLKDAYSIAGIVFVGGSLARHGGQNPIEPAALAKPILFGPHMFNFKDSRRIFLDAGAAIEVRNERALFEKMEMLIRDEQERIRLGVNAAKAVAANRGATARNLEAIGELTK